MKLAIHLIVGVVVLDLELFFFNVLFFSPTHLAHCTHEIVLFPPNLQEQQQKKKKQQKRED